MNVGANAVVGLDVELSDLWGNTLDASTDEQLYLHGGYGNIFTPVEAALEGRAIGETVEVRLEPEDAFGEYDETLVKIAQQADLPQGLEVGMLVEGIPGEADDHIYAVTDIAEGVVVLDGNHPFAGIALKVRCTVRSIRSATEDEIAAGEVAEVAGGLVRIAP